MSNQLFTHGDVWSKRLHMFGLFKKKDPIAELKKQAARLEEEAYQLSRTDRKAADLKTAEAAELWKKIAALQKAG